MPNTFKYILLVFAGPLLILLGSILQQVPPPQSSEYYYSMFLLKNYTGLTAILFFLTGLLIGYYFKLNPWLSGICLVLIFPITIVYEASLDTTSHNLLPFELIVHFVFALPAIAGVYIGRFVFKKTTKTATMHQPLEQRLNYQADFRVKYRFFAVEEGGRKTLPYQGYRPAFWYNND